MLFRRTPFLLTRLALPPIVRPHEQQKNIKTKIQVVEEI